MGLLLILLLLGGMACAEGEITAPAQLNAPGMAVGVDPGSAAEQIARDELPEAGIEYFSDKPSGYLAVAQGKLDAFVYDYNQMRIAIDSGVSGVRLLEEPLGEPVHIAVGVSPKAGIEDLMGKLNRFIAEARADGTLEDMYRRWVTDGNGTMPDIPAPEGANLHLTVGTSGVVPPYSYYVGDQLAGYDIELGHRFAAWLGADVQFKVYDYGAIVPACATGDVDCVMANLNITPERAEAMAFSDVLYEEKVGVMVRGSRPAAQAAALDAGTGLDALNGKRIGVQTGTNFDAMVAEKLPDAQVEYYNTKADLVAALTGSKVDAFAVDEPVAQLLAREDERLTWLPEYLDSYEFAPVFPKTGAGEALRDQFNAFLDQLPEGTLDALAAKWFGEDESVKTMPDIAALKAGNGTLRLATESGYAPFEYVRDGAVVGYDMELAALFCEYGGYGLEIVDMNFDGILPAVQAGKAEFAAAGIGITPERAESVLFSRPTFSGGTVLAVLKQDTADATQAAWDARLQDYNGKALGVLAGPLMEDTAREYFPDSEYLLFNSYPDCIAALRVGKVAGYLADEPSTKILHMEQPEISYIPRRLTQNNYSFAFRKNDPQSAALCSELNDFLARSWADGTMQQLDDIWFGFDEDRKVVDMSGLTGENGTIRAVTTSTDMPFSYIKDGKNVGYDIDLVVRFCRDRGYALELGDVDFAGRIPAVESGKYDFSTDMNVTPEREEQVLFSDPTSYGGIVLAVLSNDLAADGATAADAGQNAGGAAASTILDSFNKTFIRENRWRLFGQGVLTTLAITLLTILFGTLLGFAVYMLCRGGNLMANLATRFCLWLVQGMPMVVLLMILYYVVFGSVAIGGITVAVIGFTLTFGAAVFGLLKMGVGAVDAGQYEAACALGYSDRRTFYKIILPQALPHVLPAYRGEIVGLIKATAIVGYIAVQDLTKMGDIVRSRTYEAFFPLIAVTVIYFLLEGLIGFLVSRITVGFNPKRRKPADILKGVNTDDQN